MRVCLAELAADAERWEERGRPAQTKGRCSDARGCLAVAGLLTGLLAAGVGFSDDDGARQPPILITFDCHMDPLHSFRDVNLR